MLNYEDLDSMSISKTTSVSEIGKTKWRCVIVKHFSFDANVRISVVEATRKAALATAKALIDATSEAHKNL